MQKKCVFSRRLTLARVSLVLITAGKLFRRDAAATANEPYPALVRVRFTCSIVLLAERSALVN